jgi:hypothetical protein
MCQPRLWLLAGCVLAGAVPTLPAQGSETPPKNAGALASIIDRHVLAGWAAGHVVPAPPAEDKEFVRRVYLDLAGRIPSVTEVRTFLDDKRPDKRARLVQKLLNGSRYVTHFVQVWRRLMLPEADATQQGAFLAPGFEDWLRRQLSLNAGYDRMVRDLLTTPINEENPNVAFRVPNRQEATPLGFYLAKEMKPENLAAATSRLFLGVKLECAQCHNHPFAEWKRDQFWSFAAFFAGIQAQRQGDFVLPGRELADRRELTIPGTGRLVQAAFLDGKEPQWKFKTGARETLADWITSRDNPYFARALVNRLWAHFFGIGLIDPVDEMVGADHPASHPELLDELAREFAAHDFDLKYLISGITASRAYQLSSRSTHPSQDDPRRFARMALRGLSAAQLYDSVAQATGYQEGNRNPRFGFFGGNSPRAEFLIQFGNQSDKATEVQTSILQALQLMNGKVVGAATDLEKSETLAAILDAPFMDTTARIDTLYLATLSRKPTARESARLQRFVEDAVAQATSADKQKTYNQALADVFWVLLNSGEFFLNH